MDKSKKNCKVVVTANQKGGVGKTTVCVNLGIGLARAGKKVCLIDADAQGSMSASLGVQEPDSLDVTLAETSAVGKSIYLHDPRGKAASAFEGLMGEVLAHGK